MPKTRPQRRVRGFREMWIDLLHASRPAEQRRVAIVLYDPAFAARQIRLHDIQPALSEWEQRMFARARNRQQKP